MCWTAMGAAGPDLARMWVLPDTTVPDTGRSDIGLKQQDSRAGPAGIVDSDVTRDIAAHLRGGNSKHDGGGAGAVQNAWGVDASRARGAGVAGEGLTGVDGICAMLCVSLSSGDSAVVALANTETATGAATAPTSTPVVHPVGGSARGGVSDGAEDGVTAQGEGGRRGTSRSGVPWHAIVLRPEGYVPCIHGEPPPAFESAPPAGGSSDPFSWDRVGGDGAASHHEYGLAHFVLPATTAHKSERRVRARAVDNERFRVALPAHLGLVVSALSAPLGDGVDGEGEGGQEVAEQGLVTQATPQATFEPPVQVCARGDVRKAATRGVALKKALLARAGRQGKADPGASPSDSGASPGFSPAPGSSAGQGPGPLRSSAPPAGHVEDRSVRPRTSERDGGVRADAGERLAIDELLGAWGQGMADTIH